MIKNFPACRERALLRIWQFEESNDLQQIQVNVSGSVSHDHNAPSIFDRLNELADKLNAQAAAKRAKAAEIIDVEPCPAPTLTPPPPLIQAPPSAPSVPISPPE